MLPAVQVENKYLFIVQMKLGDMNNRTRSYPSLQGINNLFSVLILKFDISNNSVVCQETEADTDMLLTLST